MFDKTPRLTKAERKKLADDKVDIALAVLQGWSNVLSKGGKDV